MANKILVQDKQSPDGTVIGFWALIAIDNGDGTYSLFIKDQTTSGAPGKAAAISSSGASPVVAPTGAGEVSGTGTTGKALKWSNGPASIVTDADLAAIAASLGFTPENVANKTTDGTLAANSDTLYPSEKAVKTYVDGSAVTLPIAESDVTDLVSDLAGKQAALGFTPENVANKTTDGTLAANSDTLYPSEKAVKTYVDGSAVTLPIAESDVTDLVSDLAGKQAALGFTPENVANKTTDGTLAANSDTLYPSEKAVKTYADTKQAALGFTPENVANKTTDGTLAANSDTLYPSEKAVKTYADTKQSSLGFTPENVANKTTDGTLAANSDTLYPSEKAVKTYVDAHSSSGGVTGTGTTGKYPVWSDGAAGIIANSSYISESAGVLNLANAVIDAGSFNALTSFRHYFLSTADAGFKNTGSGDAYVNAATGRVVELQLHGAAQWRMDADGNFKGVLAGLGLYLKEGSNARMGVVTLGGGGSTVINTTAVTANSRIFVTVQDQNGSTSVTALGVGSRTAGTSFTLNDAGTDTRIVAWIIFEPS